MVPFSRHSLKTQFLVSLSLVVMVTLLGLSIHSLLGYRVVAFMLLVTVSILAMFYNIAPVLTSAALSALLWDFLFIPPRFTFSVGAPEDRLLLLMYFVIASVHAVLTNKIGQAQRLMKEKKEKERSLKFYNTLLNSLSHELRTPITTILGATDALQTSPEKLSPSNKEELINEISVASIRLNQQVENLLNMSRLESGVFQIKKDWVDISDLIYKVLQRLEPNLQHYHLLVEIPENLPLFKLDYGLMEQVIYNLIMNVTQHTPEDTQLTIQASTRNEHLTIVLADNGPGFPEKEIHKVFDKFYRVHGARSGGTGLGLSIVKGFVEAHNGTIRLENLPVRGSRFTIEIDTPMSHVSKLKDE